MHHQCRNDRDVRGGEPPGHAFERGGVEQRPSRLLQGPAAQELVVGPQVGPRVATGRLHDTGHVLERRDAGTGRGERVDLAEVRRHGKPERRRLVDERRQQVGGELRVDLDVVRTGDGELIDGLPHVGAGSHRRGGGVGGRGAVDHGR